MLERKCICKKILNREKIYIHLCDCPCYVDYSEPFRFSDLDWNAKVGLLICGTIAIYIIGFIIFLINL